VLWNIERIWMLKGLGVCIVFFFKFHCSYDFTKSCFNFSFHPRKPNIDQSNLSSARWNFTLIYSDSVVCSRLWHPYMCLVTQRGANPFKYLNNPRAQQPRVSQMWNMEMKTYYEVGVVNLIQLHKLNVALERSTWSWGVHRVIMQYYFVLSHPVHRLFLACPTFSLYLSVEVCLDIVKQFEVSS